MLERPLRQSGLASLELEGFVCLSDWKEGAGQGPQGEGRRQGGQQGSGESH